MLSPTIAQVRCSIGAQASTALMKYLFFFLETIDVSECCFTQLVIKGILPMCRVVHNRPRDVRCIDLITIGEPGCHSTSRMRANEITPLARRQVHSDDHVRPGADFEIQRVRYHQGSVWNGNSRISTECDGL